MKPLEAITRTEANKIFLREMRSGLLLNAGFIAAAALLNKAIFDNWEKLDSPSAAILGMLDLFYSGYTVYYTQHIYQIIKEYVVNPQQYLQKYHDKKIELHSNVISLDDYRG